MLIGQAYVCMYAPMQSDCSTDAITRRHSSGKCSYGELRAGREVCGGERRRGLGALAGHAVGGGGNEKEKEEEG